MHFSTTRGNSILYGMRASTHPRSTACLNLPHLPLQPQYAVVRWRWPDRASVCRYRCCSAAGHHIGTQDDEGPVSRESVEHFPTDLAAQRAPWIPMPGRSALTPDSSPFKEFS